MNWKPGDRAVLVRFDGDRMDPFIPFPQGAVVTICGPAYRMWGATFIPVQGAGLINGVDIRHLAPIPDDKATWESIEKVTGWCPQELVT